MRIYKPYLLTHSRLEDQITFLNFVYPGETLVVGTKWFQKCLQHGFLDDLCFHLVIDSKKFNPPYPELYEKKKSS